MAEPRRLDTLDALRGLAAVGVVVWHWQMLLLLGGPKLTWPPLGGDPDRSGLPFYGPLKLYYEHGFWGVDLFFVLSGFIFFHLYRRPIAEGRTSAGRFFALRFSRLYPLHLLTLLLTAGLQAAFVHHAGQPFAYDGNNARHFLANLAMVNVPDYAFNGPTWSLSVEIAMYALFWGLARTGLLKGRAAPALLVMVGLGLCAAYGGLAEQLGRGLAGFFSGGVALRLFEDLAERPRRRVIWPLVAITTLGWLVLLALVATGTDPSDRLPVGRGTMHAFGFPWLACYALLPATVVCAALWDLGRKGGDRLSAWLGSLCYSSYLIHFPLVLMLALAVQYGFHTASVAYDRLVFLGYFAVLLALSTLCHTRVEMPLQGWLRRRMLGAPRGEPQAVRAET